MPRNFRTILIFLPTRLRNWLLFSTDTLIFKFGDFYEYNPSPDNFSIQAISISTTPCYGSCPIFELDIKGDGTANYDAQEYNDKTGKFKAIIDTASFSKLIQTINYIKLTSLKDAYRVHWTDDQTVTLEIKFNDALVKKISDYGKIGTYGLQHLYSQLFALRKRRIGSSPISWNDLILYLNKTAFKNIQVNRTAILICVCKGNASAEGQNRRLPRHTTRLFLLVVFLAMTALFYLELVPAVCPYEKYATARTRVARTLRKKGANR